MRSSALSTREDASLATGSELTGRWHLFPPSTRNREPGGRLSPLSRSQLAPARYREPGGPENTVRSSLLARPLAGSSQTTYRQTWMTVDSLRGPVGNSPSAGRGGAEEHRLTGAAALPGLVSVGRPGAGGSTTPAPPPKPASLGCRDPGAAGSGRLGHLGARWLSARPALETGCGRRKRGPRAPACGREGRAAGGGGAGPVASGPGRSTARLDPPLGPPGHLEPQGTEKPAAQRRHSLPDRLGCAGRGRWTASSWPNPGMAGERAACLAPGAAFVWRQVGRACQPGVGF